MPCDFDVDAILKHVRPAEPLPPPEGVVVRVKTGAELHAALLDAKAHSTILLDDGHYRVPRDMLLAQSDVTVRSASGNREAVVIDGEGADLTQGYHPGGHAPAILRLKRARNVTIADVTFRNSPKYAVMFYGDSEVHGLNVYNVKFHNIWVRGLKGTHPARPDDRDLGERNYPAEKVEAVRPANGRVRHCLFLCDHVKTDREDGFDGDYISGIDCMGLKDWRFSDNAFVGIRGANGGGRAGIFVWVGSSGVVCERNLFVGCDRGISFGNPSQTVPGVSGGTIRDNRFCCGAGKAIEVCGSPEIDVHGNIVFDPGINRFFAVQFHMGNPGTRCHGNVLLGPLASDATVVFERNVIGHGGREWFADPERGDFALTEKGRKAVGESLCL
ncbi:MAG: right-handed parallel beta-helix repeat-containing protein [Planctomycetota bacterium]|nr:right-handed parallel beta-helix repeat-containing protein [Planctomycetota bacterium]